MVDPRNKTITKASWPKFQEKHVKDSVYEYPVSFNGKTRFKVELSLSLSKKRKEVLKHTKTKHYLRLISQKINNSSGKIVNIVV